jgi:tryptophanase
MDILRLQKLLEKSHKKVPVVYMRVTNNTGGGQPVSMQNIKEASEMTHSFGLPFLLDACRFAENAWFIQMHETGYKKKGIPEIVREMFSYADGFTISFKKDGLVNMGGGLFLRDAGVFIKKYPHLPDALMNHQIVTEGHSSYGGMSGRDIMTLAVGLRTIVHNEYLTYRIRQVHNFGMKMKQQGLPILTPIGGHAVYLDVNRFFEGTQMQPGDFGGISLTALLLSGYGHRACELGNFAFGSYDPRTQEEKFPEVNYVRFAVPRLRYEQQDLEAATEAIRVLYDHRDQIPAVDVIYGKDLPLRHFKARFQFRKKGTK